MPQPRSQKLSALPWETRFVENLPGDPEKRNFVRQVPGAAYSEVLPTAVRGLKLLGWSEELASELGIAPPDSADLALLAGNLGLPGHPSLRPYAARYGGHQFGSWAGQLGDGRAITLGEALTPSGRRMEFQLKGAGPTPYARRADGRAVLRSSLREFLCSEAMHFLGVPTTRALSLVSTGEDVVRDLFYDGNAKPEPGAVVCRVAPSFLRFGNFQILSAYGETELLKKLADFAIQEHYPELAEAGPKECPKECYEKYGLLLDQIATRTARMIADWMRVGFVHGVMNTDNMSALGLTIDYGPYGWLEPFDPDWTPNTTDAEGRRYRYGHQPQIALWNLARLAEAFLPLLGEEKAAEARALQSLSLYRDTFEGTYSGILASKLGLQALDTPEDAKFVDEMFQLLGRAETDYVLFFRSLGDWKTNQSPADFADALAPAFYAEPDSDLRQAWGAWASLYTAHLKQDGTPDLERRTAMNRVNPKYVPRNYLAQLAIDAATQGDSSVLNRLLRVLRHPYDDQPEENDLASRRPEWARDKPGCSALSCSS